MTESVRLGTAAPEPPVPQVMDAAARWCSTYHRPDLAARLGAARRRIVEHSVTICVAGDYKQGKSRLVNGLLGRTVCPVDDDFATVAFSHIAAGTDEGLLVHRRGPGREVVEDAPLDEIETYASERNNPDNRLGVRLIEIKLDVAVLSSGITIVDTPGVGAVRAGNAASVLALLPQVDALLFVTDSLSELSGPELDFLARANDACPEVLVALTKVDLAPPWRLIAAADREHLAGRHIAARIFPVSPALREEAALRGDADLAAESGVPALLSAIGALVLDPASESTLRWGLEVVEQCTGVLTSQLRTQCDVLADPDASGATLEKLASAQQRQRELRSTGSRWTSTLGDGIADLNQLADDRVRSVVRSTLEWVDAEIEGIDPAEGWEPLAAQLQTRVAEQSGLLFEEINTEATELATRLGRMIDEEAGIPFATSEEGMDVADVWLDRSRLPTSQRQAPVESLLGLIRGGAGGIYLLGVICGLAGVTVAAPLSIGVGSVFGVKQIIDERRRGLAHRRREASEIVRRFLSDIQAELGSRSRHLIKELHRALRDEFSQRIEQLTAATTAESATLRTALAEEKTKRESHLHHLKDEIQRLQELTRAAATMAEQLQGTDSNEVSP